MKKSKSYLPADAQNVTPQLVVKDAHKFANGLVELFGGKLLAEYPNPNGKGVMFAVVKIGNAKIFLSDASDFAPPTKANLFVYVPDADALVAKVAGMGGKIVAPPSNMPWGDRYAVIEDPEGNLWQIATNIEDVSIDEIKQRFAAAAAPPAE